MTVDLHLVLHLAVTLIKVCIDNNTFTHSVILILGRQQKQQAKGGLLKGIS